MLGVKGSISLGCNSKGLVEKITHTGFESVQEATNKFDYRYIERKTVTQFFERV